jgi:hypothetical protein
MMRKAKGFCLKTTRAIIIKFLKIFYTLNVTWILVFVGKTEVLFERPQWSHNYLPFLKFQPVTNILCNLSSLFKASINGRLIMDAGI